MRRLPSLVPGGRGKGVARLLVPALAAAVLASLGFAATAFATMDKTVRLDVDGQHVAIRTFASDIAGVLRDLLAPASVTSHAA